MLVILFFLSRLHVTNSPDGCLGPFPGWLSGPPMAHNEVSLLPSGRGHVLCCFGRKGAWPAAPGRRSAGAALRMRPTPMGGTPVAIVSKRAVCPAEAKQNGDLDHLLLPPPSRMAACEPFLSGGCAASLSPNGTTTGACDSLAGFPAVPSHGGCSSKILSGGEWVHTKCCHGEIGHVGEASTTGKPRHPHLRIGVFPTLTQCMHAKCPPQVNAPAPCRCSFPTHVCGVNGPTDCIEVPDVWSINMDATCHLSSSYYSSVGACMTACGLQEECVGFEVDKATLKLCRLYTYKECSKPLFGPNVGSIVFTNQDKYSKHHKPPVQRARAMSITLALAVWLLFLSLVFLPLFFK